MTLKEVIEFINNYLPGIITWVILTHLTHRKFHAVISIFEVIIFTGIISLISPYTGKVNEYVLAILFGIMLTYLSKTNILLKIVNALRITSKSHPDGAWFAYVDKGGRMCYVHLNDGTIIYGFIQHYSNDKPDFFLGSPYYIKVTEQEGHRKWALNDVVANSIYFNDFSQIKYIEFEENSKEIKSRNKKK